MKKIELTLEEARRIDKALLAGRVSFTGLCKEDKFRDTLLALHHNKWLSDAEKIMSSKLKKIRYDPTKWNKFPNITPPEDVMMRVELSNGMCFGAYYHSFLECGWWVHSDGTTMPKAYSDAVTRFRPWED